MIDDGDVEVGRIARFLAAGCSCKLANGGPCCKIFSPAQYRSQRDECRELTHDELDLVVMGELRALTQRDPVTQMTKRPNAERVRSSTHFRAGGHRVCIKTFCFLHSISVSKFNSIKASFQENGLRPRHRPHTTLHNATKLSDVQYVVHFILQHAHKKCQ